MIFYINIYNFINSLLCDDNTRTSMAHLNAAIGRVGELKGQLETCDNELATLARRLEGVEGDTRGMQADKEAELAAGLESDRAALDDQLQADVLLTVHFQDTANQQVVRALIDKQDPGILEEETVLRQRLMEIAERELKRREDEMTAVYESIRTNLLKVDEDSHSASLQAVYVRHKETMAKIYGGGV